MASKLDYLKKYLATPGGGGGTDAAPSKRSSGGAMPVKEKKKKKSKGIEASMQIRDMSEILPAAREERRGPDLKRKLLATEDPEALKNLNEEPEFVDEELVEEAKRATANEISGIKWAIKQHRKPPTRQAIKQPVKEEEGGASGSDLDVARPVKKGTPPRARAAPAAAAADADSDLDLPRPGQGKAPPKRKPAGGDSDGDLSPPRAVKKEDPVKRESGVKEEPASDDDVSPPRKPAGKAGGAGKKARHDSDSDISVPRAGGGGGGKQRHDSDDDISPPRGGGAAAAGGRRRHDSDEDISPPRKGGGGQVKRQRHDSDSDLSPPRGGGDEPEPEEEEKMSSGLRSGLVSGQKLKEEAAKVRAERRAAVEAMPDEETGKGATTVYRGKDGTKITREEWVGEQKKKRKKKLSEYPEQELEWGGGLKQTASREAEKAEVERVAAQPFARYELDEKAVEELKAKSDWNDPMRKFEADEDAGPRGPGAPPVVKKPKCPHAPWPNRFDILPGYRWDGKVRGNNYEKKWLETKNTRRLRKQEAWKEDMEDQ